MVSHSVQRGILLQATGTVGGAAWATTNWWYTHDIVDSKKRQWAWRLFITSSESDGQADLQLSYLLLLSFWTNALLITSIGAQNLVGGTTAAWVITLGVRKIHRCLFPVTTVQPLKPHDDGWQIPHAQDLPLRCVFYVWSGVRYTAVSYQGSLEALPRQAMWRIFTRYTVAHALFRMYSFYTMTMFGRNVLHSPAPDTQRVEFRTAHKGSLLDYGSWGCWLILYKLGWLV